MGCNFCVVLVFVILMIRAIFKNAVWVFAMGAVVGCVKQMNGSMVWSSLLCLLLTTQSNNIEPIIYGVMWDFVLTYKPK